MNQEDIIALAVNHGPLTNKLLTQMRNLHYGVYGIPLVVKTDGDAITTHPNLWFGYDGYNHPEELKKKYKLPDRIGNYRCIVGVLDEAKIERQESTKLGRFIKKAYGAHADEVKDNQIRDLSEKLRMALDPEGLKKFVIFPDTIESYYDMFNMNNGSCLQVGTHHYGDAVAAQWELMHKHHGMHPGAWIMYNPRLQGVYMVDGKRKTVARAILYMHEGVAVGFDYSKGLGMNSFVLEMLLFNNVIKADDKLCTWKNDKPFTIPGVRLPDDPEVYFPWPTLDQPVKADGMYVAYDAETETLRCADSPQHPYLNGFKVYNSGDRYSHKGFAKASKYGYKLKQVA